MFTGLLDLAFVVFAIVLLADYTKVRAAAPLGFSFIAAGGILFLLAASFAELSIFALVTNAVYGQWLFEGIGFILLLIGALLTALKLLPLKK